MARGGGRGKGRGRSSGGGKNASRRGSQGRGRPSPAGPESDPTNEHLFTDVDRFHMEKDKINFSGGGSDSDESDESEQEEAVMNLEGASDSDSSDQDDSDDDDSDGSGLPDLPEHVRRAAIEAPSDEDSDEEAEGSGKFAEGWGKKRSSYYNADTADLEIGQEFEDAEAEEEAALELQKESYKRLDPADYGEDEEDEEEGATRKRAKKGKAGRTAQEAALLAMKSDLEQIALGVGEVETSVVKRDTSKLSRRDKLELVLSEAPELPALLGEVRTQLETLTETVQPMVLNVTADLGASKDGLVYLRTRQQLLLAYCMNVCFYMILKAKGEPAKGHPVVRRLLSLRALLAEMSKLDEKMSSQVDLLLRALASGIDLAGAGGGDSDEEEEASDDDDVSIDGGSVSSTGDSAGGIIEEVDEKDLEEEEARFMGNASSGSGSEEDEVELSPSAAKKKRRRAAKKKALADSAVKAAAGGATGDVSLGDFGDEDMDERPEVATARRIGGENILQSMMNRISQREGVATGKRRRVLQGDLDVPIKERDQSIRVRRPAPGDSEEDDGSGAGSNTDDDLGMGGDGFLGGLPPGLLEGLSRRSGAAGDQKKKKTGKSKESKREHDDGEGREEGEEKSFYAAVSEEKERKKRAKKEKYHPLPRIAGALEAELEAERAGRGETKRGASYTIIKNRGLTPHKNKLNRNPRSKKREAFRKATIRRKGQVRDIRTGEADTYGGESTGIKSNVTRSRKLKG